MSCSKCNTSATQPVVHLLSSFTVLQVFKTFCDIEPVVLVGGIVCVKTLLRAPGVEMSFCPQVLVQCRCRSNFITSNWRPIRTFRPALLLPTPPYRCQWGTWGPLFCQPRRHDAAACSQRRPAAGSWPPAGGAPSAARRRTAREDFEHFYRWQRAQWGAGAVGGGRGWWSWDWDTLTRFRSPVLMQSINSASGENKETRASYNCN